MPLNNIPLDPEPSTLSEQEALYMAKLAESAERYDEMTDYMIQCVAEKNGDDLTHEQRNLISVGYKNLMSARRTAWRQIHQNLETEAAGKSDQFKAKGKEYENQIIAEVEKLIDQVEEKVVKKFTAPGPCQAQKTEVKVFFKKMEGDYNRYGAEVSAGNEAQKEKFKKKAEAAYEEATKECENQVKKGTNKWKEEGGAPPGDDVTETEDELPPTNPIRLGLALNFSVFMYEILEEKEKASGVAQDAFDKAIEKLDELNEDQYRDSTLIMQLLKDNLNLWMGGEENDGYQ